VRVTAEARERTRKRILEAAARLFAARGFQETTTRDLAAAAGIAAGTLFNYHASKEELALGLVGEAAAQGIQRYEETRRDDQPVDEELFALVVEILRALEPHRALVGELVAATLSPAAPTGAFRTQHLEIVGEILLRHGHQDLSGTHALHLYWTLFVGVLAWWTGDSSPHQEDTLALLDRTTRLFVETVRPHRGDRESSDDQ
jgi:AcrR family transcriptional regulator